MTTAQQISQLQSQLSAAIQQVNRDHANTIATLNAQHASAMAQARTAQARQAENQSHNAAVRDANQATAQAIADLRAQFTQARQSILAQAAPPATTTTTGRYRPNDNVLSAPISIATDTTPHPMDVTPAANAQNVSQSTTDTLAGRQSNFLTGLSDGPPSASNFALTTTGPGSTGVLPPSANIDQIGSQPGAQAGPVAGGSSNTTLYVALALAALALFVIMRD